MIKAVTTTTARQLVLRLGDSARLPEALLTTLRDEVVLGGWMRASGVLHDVRIRALGGGAVRTLVGAVHAVVLEGSIGVSQGDISCGLRAVLSRETDSGLETIAGDIIDARVGDLEAFITALDDVSLVRQPTPAGVWLMEPTDAKPRAPAPTPVAVNAAPAPAPAPAPANAAPAPAPASDPMIMKAPASAPSLPSNDGAVQKPTAPKPSPTYSAPTAMPLRPVKPQVEEVEQVCPDAGDVVEHFAFGRCEVVKSDGDRLHLRLGKDGRIKEIALEMLRVTPLPPADGVDGKHFKLDRKL